MEKSENAHTHTHVSFCLLAAVFSFFLISQEEIDKNRYYFLLCFFCFLFFSSHPGVSERSTAKIPFDVCEITDRKLSLSAKYMRVIERKICKI